MGKIITVSNQKGGTVKTVSCQHLAYAAQLASLREKLRVWQAETEDPVEFSW